MVDIPNSIGVPSVNPEIAAPDQQLDVQPKAAAALQQFGAGATDLSKIFGQVQVNDVTNNVMKQARQITDQFQSLRGQDALNAQASTQAALDKVFSDGGNQLSSLDQVNQYNQTTRTYQDRYFGGMIAQHAAQAGLDYATETNNNTFQGGLDTIGGNPSDPNAFQLGLNQAIGAKVKQLQLEGNAHDPLLMKQAVTQATQSAWITRITAVGTKDPAQALQLADENSALLGDKYAPIYDELRSRAQDANDGAIAQGVVNGTPAPGRASSAPSPQPAAGTAPSQPSDGTAVTPPKVTQQQVFGAFLGQEGSGSIAPGTSVTGAVGGLQIEPATFDANKNPGESITRPGDQLAVANRTLNKYYQQYEGDPNRIAVAWFSGPGNVAPPGSATPWIKDVADPTGKTVSSYVAGIDGKLTSGSYPSAKANAYQKVLDMHLPPDQQNRVLSLVSQQLTAQQIAQQSNDNQRTLADQKASGGYMQQLLQIQQAGGVVPQTLATSIINDQNLLPDTKYRLGELALSATGSPNTMGYGPSYMSTFKSVVSPYGTPGKITDTNSIYGLVTSGKLTMAGAQNLIGVLKDSSGSIDEQGLATAREAALTWAHKQLSYEDPTQPFSPKDPVGEAAFDTKFIPQFEAGLTAWTKAGKDPMAYLQNTDALTKMVNAIRSPAQMAQDQLLASGGEPPAAPGAPQAPAPSPPGTVKNSGEWSTVMGQLPQTANGPYPQQQWGRIVSWLMADPKTNVPIFDKKFGNAGYDGAQIVAQLSNPPADTLASARQTWGQGAIGR